MRVSIGAKLALAAAALTAGCHLIGGADQYSVRDDATGGAGPTTSVGGTSTMSGGSGGCVAVVEDCLNGVDDDCDGDSDCDDSDCGQHSCQALPAGATLVVPTTGAGQCEGALLDLQMAECGDCGCALDDPGACSFSVELYDNASCNGTPSETIAVTPSGCSSAATTAAMGQTVGSVVTTQGLGDALCVAAESSVDATARFFCELPNAGSCSSGDGCVPDGSNLSCALLDGDVDCIAPYTDKSVVHDRSNSDTCSCDCRGGQQQCPADKHVHHWDSASCGGVKVDVVGESGCTDLGVAAVVSLDNHDQPLAASDAACVNDSHPLDMPPVKTLCCLP